MIYKFGGEYSYFEVLNPFNNPYLLFNYTDNNDRYNNDRELTLKNNAGKT